ncbi:TOBE domain-containing protein [Desulfosarcina sp. OttesenSCG-928-A07]|nr:TOBE domain-containing protein [Desulfosarcina sp. OttesenSCG-928-G17]MDL2330079.1 TOBE domain-containing protein [Desulfosarcina sp. OttesenSCG-928-A07]
MINLYKNGDSAIFNGMDTPQRISSSSETEQLDPLQLSRLEQSFRDWAFRSERQGVRVSRKRILLIFLLIRYTGAKLNEVLSLRPATDVDREQKTISFGGHSESGSASRQVQVSDALLADFLTFSRDLEMSETGCIFTIDPAFVRRKFYERAQACGFSKRQGGPEMLRKARALELMRENLPLPAVQKMLGLSTLDLASAHVTFSEQELQAATRWFLERESGRTTSARNSFFGKITALGKGSVQSLIALSTTDGKTINTIVTNDSVKKMGLNIGKMVTAEIKAPWLIIERPDRPGTSSADNAREGEITKITRGKVNTECIVQIGQRMELCAVVSTPGFDKLSLDVGDRARVIFSCYSVILHTG